MNCKIIVSSGSFLRLLQDMSFSDQVKKVEIFDGKLYIQSNDRYLDVEHIGEIDQEYSDRQFMILRNFLSKIPEQPITLNFTDDWNGSIEILCAVITGNQ